MISEFRFEPEARFIVVTTHAGMQYVLCYAPNRQMFIFNRNSDRPALALRATLVLLVVLMSPGITAAQDNDAAKNQMEAVVGIVSGMDDRATREEVIDEIIVIESRPTVQIEADIRNADVQMYTIFNVLNEDKEYDIHCNWEKRGASDIGSNIKVHVCKPQYERGIDTYQWSGPGDMINLDSSIRTPQSQIVRNHRILQQKMISIAEKNPEFAESIIKRANLQREYDHSRQRSLE